MNRIDLIDFAHSFDSEHGSESASEAIQRALDGGWTLNTYDDPTADAREGVDADYATEVADEDMSLVYLTR